MGGSRHRKALFSASAPEQRLKRVPFCCNQPPPPCFGRSITGGGRKLGLCFLVHSWVHPKLRKPSGRKTLFSTSAPKHRLRRVPSCRHCRSLALDALVDPLTTATAWTPLLRMHSWVHLQARGSREQHVQKDTLLALCSRPEGEKSAFLLPLYPLALGGQSAAVAVRLCSRLLLIQQRLRRVLPPPPRPPCFGCIGGIIQSKREPLWQWWRERSLLRSC